ncbi:fluoride efflux transporter CrcB [Capnocytophaga canimorsus]|uniref:Fluoride-specific ion channel FluC n=1 Tax=Capnocytophaga canimorsus TaxID=28188 RepID=A0AAC9Z3Z6_9FLAO|nr:fluoride efflux transporter CrcB [Capnocytophaga canimorsus]ATA94150.1 chromosome condensation protein CrcB [Capnocytophaga canimorsus]GJQ05412.1 putative fluoride ion transporter CrcB [Capnocytophaga canimorsus]
MLKSLLYVGLGSALGGVFRFLCYFLITLKFGKNFPTGTFIINGIGSFLIGFLFVFFHKRNFSADLQIFLLTGVLGGFTTFSAFSLETLQLIEQKECYKAIIYVLGSVFLGVVACFGGYLLAHWGHK